MKRLLSLFLVATVSSSAFCEQRINFDDGWRFYKEPILAGSTSIGPFRWRKQKADVTSLDVSTPPASGPWEETNGQMSRRARFEWFQTDIGSDPRNKNRKIHFEAVDDNAAIYLNGLRLTTHIGWDDPFDVPVAKAWKDGKANILTILVENTGGEGGIVGPVDWSSIESVPNQVKPGFDDRGWQWVRLPHDYVIEGPFDPNGDISHGSQPKPIGWYRKTFTLPAKDKGKSMWIDFDGVFRNSTVWLNGKELGRQPDGYIGFRFDISDKVNFGRKNVLVVRTDPRQNEGWWYEGGGIYRHVWLSSAPKVHLAPDGLRVRSTVKGGVASVVVTAKVVGPGFNLREFFVSGQIVGPDSKPLHGSRAIVRRSPDGSGFAELAFSLKNPRLWSIEHPALYRMVTTLGREHKLIDRRVTTFGIRTLAFDANKGFFLNGKSVKIKGVCNHQDHAGLGVALPDSINEWRVRKLQEMGCNAIRTSHNAPTPELLDICDRLGMLVMDETRHFGDATGAKSSPNTKTSDLTELKSMILRDRNHPSVIMWSMANEEGIQGSKDGARIFAAMKKVTNELDGTRPVTAAMNGGWDSKEGMGPLQDLLGLNYSVGQYDKMHELYPNIPIYGSETASTVSTRGIYANDKEKGYVSAYDVNPVPWGNTAEGAWRPIAERPWMLGGFVWTGFDYKGEPTPYGWPCINSHFGIIDIAGFPKDNFWYYKAWWGDKPVVHILPHWNWPGKKGQKINVWVHSNAARVDLRLNGKSLGVKAVPKLGHVEWDVPYADGRLEAVGYSRDMVVARDVVETAGPPAALRLKSSRKSLKNDQVDAAIVEVEIVDAKGRIVPTADNLVKFTWAGKNVAKILAVDSKSDYWDGKVLLGVGNGDPSSHESDKGDKRRAFNGRCMVVVKAPPHCIAVKVTAASVGLKEASYTFAVK